MSDSDKRSLIRDKLKRNNLTYAWLIVRLKEYHLHVDKSEMSSILNGTRKGNKADEVLRYSQAILLHYEKCFPIIDG